MHLKRIDKNFVKIIGKFWKNDKWTKRNIDEIILEKGGEIYDSTRWNVNMVFFFWFFIFRDEKLLPGIKLGINIKDNCNSESHSLHQTISLIDDPSNEDIEVIFEDEEYDMETNNTVSLYFDQ